MDTTDLSSIRVPPIPNCVSDRIFNEAEKHRGLYEAGVAAWLVFDAEGDVTQNKAYGLECNASIKSGAYVFGYQTATGSGPEYEAFYDWLLRRSWIAPYVVAPSTEFARDVGFLLSGDMPSNFLVGALTLQRTWCEHRCRVRDWYRFVTVFGCPEDLAFLCAFSFHSGEGWDYINTNHNSISPDRPSYWHNFVNRQVARVNDPFSSGASYRGITEMWGECDGEYRFNDKLIESLKEPEPVAVDRVVVPNPFKPVVTKQSEAIVINKRLLESLLPKIISVYSPERPTSPMPLAVNS